MIIWFSVGFADRPPPTPPKINWDGTKIAIELLGTDVRWSPGVTYV